MNAEGAALTRYWTETQDSFLKENYRRLPASVIGVQLGKTRSSVIGRAHRIGLGLPFDEIFKNRFRPAPNGIRAKRKMAELTPKVPTSDKDYLRQNLVNLRPKNVVQKVGIRLPPTPVAADTIVPLNGVGVSIWDIGHSQCRWVVGEPKAMMFCGHKKTEGSSYCPSHFAVSKFKRTK